MSASDMHIAPDHPSDPLGHPSIGQALRFYLFAGGAVVMSVYLVAAVAVGLT